MKRNVKDDESDMEDDSVENLQDGVLKVISFEDTHQLELRSPGKSSGIKSPKSPKE